ncbi:hypothetical protein E2320_002328, partial [Naja naja]
MAYLTGRLLEVEQKWLERRPGMRGESVQHKTASAKVQDGVRVAETVNFVKKCYTCGSIEHLQRHCPERRNRAAARQGYRTTQHMWNDNWIEEDRPEIKREDTEDVDSEDIEEERL